MQYMQRIMQYIQQRITESHSLCAGCRLMQHMPAWGDDSRLVGGTASCLGEAHAERERWVRGGGGP